VIPYLVKRRRRRIPAETPEIPIQHQPLPASALLVDRIPVVLPEPARSIGINSRAVQRHHIIPANPPCPATVSFFPRVARPGSHRSLIRSTRVSDQLRSHRVRISCPGVRLVVRPWRKIPPVGLSCPWAIGRAERIRTNSRPLAARHRGKSPVQPSRTASSPADCSPDISLPVRIHPRFSGGDFHRCIALKYSFQFFRAVHRKRRQIRHRPRLRPDQRSASACFPSSHSTGTMPRKLELHVPRRRAANRNRGFLPHSFAPSRPGFCTGVDRPGFSSSRYRSSWSTGKPSAPTQYSRCGPMLTPGSAGSVAPITSHPGAHQMHHVPQRRNRHRRIEDRSPAAVCRVLRELSGHRPVVASLERRRELDAPCPVP